MTRGELAVVPLAASALFFFALTDRWLLFAVSAALGIGMPLLGLTAPSQWQRAMGGLTGRRIRADVLVQRKARIAAGAVAAVAAAALVTGLAT